MQIHSLRLKSYRSWTVDDRAYSPFAKNRQALLQKAEQMKAHGCPLSTIFQVLEISRSHYFRLKKRYQTQGLAGLEALSRTPKKHRTAQWSKPLERLIVRLRQQHPTWGKNKLHCLLQRDHHQQVSLATVGRILSHLIGQQRIPTARQAAGKSPSKKSRVFNRHAQRWRYGMKSQAPGQLVQIDHMSVSYAGVTIKHFKAICPRTKIMVCAAYKTASSKNASHFLTKILQTMPFPIQSIQVDGGSEFMKDFEVSCAQRNIPLLVLPPRSPKYNGVVERCNGVTRDDFYASYRHTLDLPTLNHHLQAFQHQYNHYRPHQTLANLTPFAYFAQYHQNRNHHSPESLTCTDPGHVLAKYA